MIDDGKIKATFCVYFQFPLLTAAAETRLTVRSDSGVSSCELIFFFVVEKVGKFEFMTLDPGLIFESQTSF